MSLSPFSICSLTVACLMAATVGCTKKSDSQPPAEPLEKRGRAAYQSSCTACHNSNPKQPGSLGPDIWGSSAELLRARVMTATYPPGYKPKRPTKVMVALPHLEKDLPALHAFLNAP